MRSRLCFRDVCVITTPFGRLWIPTNCRKATSCERVAGRPGVLLSMSHTTHFRDEGQAASPPCTSFDSAPLLREVESDEVSANAAPQPRQSGRRY